MSAVSFSGGDVAEGRGARRGLAAAGRAACVAAAVLALAGTGHARAAEGRGGDCEAPDALAVTHWSNGAQDRSFPVCPYRLLPKGGACPKAKPTR